MTRSLIAGALALLLPGGLMAADAAGKLSVDYTFDAPRLTDTDETRVMIAGCGSFHRIGQPELPFRTAKILLPAGARVASVVAAPLTEEQIVPLNAPVAFGRQPVPIGLPDHPAVAKAATVRPDPATYGADAPYPAGRAELVSVQRLVGSRRPSISEPAPELYVGATPRTAA